MIIPPYLREGDTIALAAPARKISEEELRPAIALLRREGFRVHYDERLFAQDHQFAGSDEVRAAYLQDLIDSPDIQAIWCARGGYGSVRLLDRLDFRPMLEHPKWLCGYSDVTAFHAHLHTCCDMATLHCTMPINVTDETMTTPAVTTMLDALRGKALCYELPDHPLNRPGNVTAPVVGGNLSVLYSLTGSRSDLDTEGKILFLEDLDEYLYHIDRMMYNLKRSGRLDGISGLLVGHLSDMHDNTIPFGHTAEEIVAECCAEYDFPLLFNFPAGHLPDNRAIKMGFPISIQASEKGIVSLQTATPV
ncbi:MAG: LD-carboxypeptidase [Bacteroidales bacterium]|nr:LD-carboxypeptidase [Bacteroidales bacterium]